MTMREPMGREGGREPRKRVMTQGWNACDVTTREDTSWMPRGQREWRWRVGSRRAMGAKGGVASVGRFERAGTRFEPAAAPFGADEDRALDDTADDAVETECTREPVAATTATCHDDATAALCRDGTREHSAQAPEARTWSCSFRRSPHGRCCSLMNALAINNQPHSQSRP